MDMSLSVSTYALVPPSLPLRSNASTLITASNISAHLPFSTTSNLCIALIGVVIPFFIFAVTLLGSAVEKAKEEESAAKLKGKKNFDAKIGDLENKVKAAKVSGDGTQLDAELEDLTRSRRLVEGELAAIQDKYTLLNFRNSVAIPTKYLISGLAINEAAFVLKNLCPGVSIVLWVLGLAMLACAISKIYKCLLLVEEISLGSDEYQNRKLAAAFNAALALHEKGKEPSLRMTVKSPEFPTTVAPGADLKITFRMNMKNGKRMNDANVWFYVPDGFTLVKPVESWRQAADFVIPNIRTVELKIGDVNQGSHVPSTLELKAPITPGEYSIMCYLRGEGYAEESDKLKVTVKSP